jgi:hypothetical protein
MTQSRPSPKIQGGPIEGIDADVSVDRVLERSDTVTLLESTGTEDTTAPVRPVTICTRKRLFISSLVLVVAIMGTLIGVFVSRAGDDGGEGTPDSLSRTTVETSPTTKSNKCEDEGYFCSFPEGICGDGGEGKCIPKPEMCTMDYTPVCGCDGVTYGNSCSAASTGVSVNFQGECDTPSQGCSDCEGEDDVCVYPEGDCGVLLEGNCIPKPEMCTMDYTPVCGCDGVTYGNSCSAASKGVSINFQGECDTPSQGCSDCEGEDDVCVYPEGDCGVLLEGNCTPKPAFCNRMEAPVCGCDGISYVNACIAISEGSSIYAQGECVP